MGLLSPNGDEVVPTQVLKLTETAQSFSFDGLGAHPVPSILRGFSAPVIIERDTSVDEKLHLLAHDTDPFNRWEAGRQLAKDEVIRSVFDAGGPSDAFFDALGRMAGDDRLDPAFRAFALALPSVDDLSQTLFEAGTTPDPVAVHAARGAVLAQIGDALKPTLTRLFDEMRVDGPYSPDATSAGKRALRLKALGLLAHGDAQELGKAHALFNETDNMTESLGAMSILIGGGQGEAAVATFYDRWKSNANVLDKWFAIKIAQSPPETTVQVTQALTEHPDFHWRTPNRFRSVIGALGGNSAGFHDASGAGYRLVADWLIRLDPVNPQTAARMSAVFETWRRYDGDRQGMMRDALASIRSAPDLSGDMREMVTRMLED